MAAISRGAELKEFSDIAEREIGHEIDKDAYWGTMCLLYVLVSDILIESDVIKHCGSVSEYMKGISCPYREYRDKIAGLYGVYSGMDSASLELPDIELVVMFFAMRKNLLRRHYEDLSETINDGRKKLLGRFARGRFARIVLSFIFGCACGAAVASAYFQIM